MNQNFKILSLAVAAGGMALSSAKADFAAGDLILYFQQSGGTNTVAVDLGAATIYRDTSVSLINIVNIGTLLSNGTLGFGSTWYDSSTLYWGAAGVFSNSANTTNVQDGDPFRTIYTTKARTVSGTDGFANSNAWSIAGTGTMTTGSTNIQTQNNHFGSAAGSSASTGFAEPTSTSAIDNANQNPFTAGNPGTAYQAFPGGVEAGFGAGTFDTVGGVSAESALDLYRILAATGASGQVDGTLRGGDYEGSLVVDNGGNVSFIKAVPEPSSAMLIGATMLLGGFIRRRKSVA